MKFFKPKYILPFLFLIFGLSCQEQPKETQPEEPQTKIPETFDFSNKKTVELTPEAKTETSQWLAFITAQSEVEDFRNLGVEYVMENAPATLQIMQNLQQTIPQKFKETPVESRINVLITLAQALKQESGNREPEREKIVAMGKKIPVAFDNLKIQLNEIFAKSLEEFQLELETRSDSLRLAGQKPISDSIE